MAPDTDDLARDVTRRQHEIDAARGDRAAWHRVMLGAVVLGERHAAGCLDRSRPERAVVGRSGQDHAHRALALLLGECTQKLVDRAMLTARRTRSEEHTSELQSRQYLVCRLLLEKKKKKKK